MLRHWSQFFPNMSTRHPRTLSSTTSSSRRYRYSLPFPPTSRDLGPRQYLFGVKQLGVKTSLTNPIGPHRKKGTKKKKKKTRAREHGLTVSVEHGPIACLAGTLPTAPRAPPQKATEARRADMTVSHSSLHSPMIFLHPGEP